jgi:hypothetical protein
MCFPPGLTEHRRSWRTAPLGRSRSHPLGRPNVTGTRQGSVTQHRSLPVVPHLSAGVDQRRVIPTARHAPVGDFSAFSTAARTDVRDGHCGRRSISVGRLGRPGSRREHSGRGQPLEANPALACVPGIRPALMAAATDYQKAAIDADNATGTTAPARTALSAIADLQAADAASNNADNEIAAATTATEKFDN